MGKPTLKNTLSLGENGKRFSSGADKEGSNMEYVIFVRDS
jgi:hypothetical protein